jgi:hypothetical protein
VIKVKHSKSKRALLVDFSGPLGKEDIDRAHRDIQAALDNIGRGYTLIEIFHDHPYFEPSASLEAGLMVGLFYKNNRIWRVIRVEENEQADPGLSILHKTRWARSVPELTMDNIRQAVATAREEAQEQFAWWSSPSDPAPATA